MVIRVVPHVIVSSLKGSFEYNSPYLVCLRVTCQACNKVLSTTSWNMFFLMIFYCLIQLLSKVCPFWLLKVKSSAKRYCGRSHSRERLDAYRSVLGFGDSFIYIFDTTVLDVTANEAVVRVVVSLSDFTHEGAG